MSFSDPIGDMLTRIRNAQMRRKNSVSTPASTLRGRVLDVLQSEGFIRGYSETKFENGAAEYEIGRRVYASVKNLPQVANGLGVSILSTPKGVMADHEAKAANVGGEVLCRVF